MKNLGLLLLVFFCCSSSCVWGQSLRDTLLKVARSRQPKPSEQHRKLRYLIYAGHTTTELLDSVELEIIRSGKDMYLRIGTVSENFYNEKESLLIDHENRVMWLEGFRPYPDGLPVSTLTSWLAALDTLIQRGDFRLTGEAGRLTLSGSEAMPWGNLVLVYEPSDLSLRSMIFYCREATPLLHLHTKEPLRIELEILSLSDRGVMPDRMKFLNGRQPARPYAHYSFTNLLR